MANVMFRVIALSGLSKNFPQAIISISTFALVAGIHCASAQIVGTPAGISEGPLVLTQPPAPSSPLPARVQAIRSAQDELARATGIIIMQHEYGERSSTALGGVPPELRNRTIETQSDLISSIDALYPYYGFSGSETLEYDGKRDVFGQTQYYFRQYIDNIETSEQVAIYVDKKTKQVVAMPGALQIDRNFDRVPRLSMQQAIDVAIRHVQQSEGFNGELYDFNGPHDANIVYRNVGPNGVLVACWQVSLAVSDRFAGALGTSFFIEPDGEVATGRISVP